MIEPVGRSEMVEHIILSVAVTLVLGALLSSLAD